MEFNEKLQQLRTGKNLTQEQLAEQLYVSRTAISKWESGKGYPNIESLKCISKFFSVTIDELLSNLKKILQLYLWNIGYDGSCVYISSVIWKLCWRLCLCGQSTIIYSHHTIQSCSLLECFCRLDCNRDC